MNKNWFRNRTIVITGASSGIGRMLCYKFITDYNCKVIAIGRNESNFKKLEEKLGENSKKLTCKIFDVSKKENWIKFKDFLLEREIKVDILVNCAGEFPKLNKFFNYPLEQIDKIMKTNFNSSVYSSIILYPILKQSIVPAIINVGCSSCLIGLCGASLYSASKMALKSYTESLMQELDGEFYVSIILSGLTKTDFFRFQEIDKNEIKTNRIIMDVDKLTDKIINGLKKKKKKILIGLDSKIADNCSRFMPYKSNRIVNGYIKNKKIKMFKCVYEKENKIKED